MVAVVDNTNGYINTTINAIVFLNTDLKEVKMELKYISFRRSNRSG